MTHDPCILVYRRRTVIKQTRQGHHQVDIIGIQVKNVLVQDPLVSIPLKSLFLGTTTTSISTSPFRLFIHGPIT
ncbi:hypothetical protein BDF22DRAFT_742000 [Syncephalis plumigaleata]|nr:hypothetical protein BDF22DRAFT_742000 [Syncephalis plumigaleata]